MDELPCSAIVFRALTRKSWIDKSTQRVLPAAFMRRPSPQDEDGLSVNIESAASSTAPFRESFGAVSLHVGRLRDLGLHVVIDAAPHANLASFRLTLLNQAKTGCLIWTAHLQDSLPY